jgi:hypothetical protein
MIESIVRQGRSGVRWATPFLFLLHLSPGIARAQAASSPAVTPPAPARAPYLQRGDEIETEYGAYRKQLEAFFDALHQRVEKEAPEHLPGLVSPVPVPYGYQILPTLLPDLPRRGGGSRLGLSPFSWPILERSLKRDGIKLDSLNARLADAVRAADPDRRRDYGGLVAEYKKLLASQKLIANQIQYNRFWQGDIATHPVWYARLKSLQEAALDRQLINDVLSFGDDHFDPSLRARADSLTQRINDWIQKSPTPDFVHLEQPAPRRWILRVPVFTDIQDSAFIEGFRQAIENGWHVHDGKDDFGVKLEIRRVSPSELYPDGHIPEKGAHIDLDAHAARFPQGGVVLTTGGNAVRALARGIILSPFSIRPATLVHEFGHMLGFKDGYFRSYDDLGSEGYEVLEVVLPQEEIVAAPNDGHVRREYFEQILREKQR